MTELIEGKKPLDHYIGPIITNGKGVRIKGRQFQGAIGIIGGATGLEALLAAEEFPNSAVIVIDPLAQFGKKVIGQLGKPGSEKNGIDLSFLDADPKYKTHYPGLLAVWHLKNRKWREINNAYLSHQETAATSASRIFFIEEPISAVTAERPIFNIARMIYPDLYLTNDYSLFEFMAKSLKDGAQLEIATESYEVYLRYRMYGGEFVTAHGGVRRPNGIVRPISTFDFLFDGSGYNYVNIQKKDGKFPKPNKLYFAANQDTFGHLFLSIPYSLGILGRKKHIDIEDR